MTFREFVDDMKGAAVHIAPRPGRPLSPFVMFDTANGPQGQPVDSGFFDPDRPGDTGELVESYVLPAITQNAATKVAWLFSARQRPLTPADALADTGFSPHNFDEDALARDGIAVVVIDREVHEVWFAPLSGDGSGELGEWEAWPANEQAGRLVTPIQEALR